MGFHRQTHCIHFASFNLTNLCFLLETFVIGVYHSAATLRQNAWLPIAPYIPVPSPIDRMLNRPTILRHALQMKNAWNTWVFHEQMRGVRDVRKNRCHVIQSVFSGGLDNFSAFK